MGTMSARLKSARLLASCGATLVLGLQAVPCMAQAVETPSGSTTPPAPAAQASEDGLQDIVVTAQKRTERLQQVPISATVLSGATLTAQGTLDLQQITGTVADTFVVRSGPSDRLIVRGIGSADNFSVDQSVATFVDGIYHGRSRSSGAGFLDLDRIEVLKGPQSIFFGNSAIGGAFNVSTRKPSDTFMGDASASYNFDFNEVTVEAGVGGPISSTLSFRLAGNFSRGDGWLYDIGAGEHIPRTNNKALRGQLQWKPVDALTVNLKAEVGRFRQQGGILLQLVDCPPPAPFTAPRGFCTTAIASGVETQLDDRRTATPGSHSNLNTQEYVGSIDYDLGGATLTSLTGYLKHDFDYSFDADGPIPADLLDVAAPEAYHQFSQELRLTSATGHFFDYIFGLYYQHDRVVTEQDLTYGLLSPTVQAAAPFASLIPYLPIGQAVAYAQSQNTYSAFGSVTAHLTPKLRLVGGLRYTSVSKSADKSIYFGTGSGLMSGVTPFPAAVLPVSLLLTRSLGPTVANHYERTDRHASPSVNLQYDVTSNVLAYAKYANGFKAGGFNGQDVSADQAAVPFNSETVNAYELGLKSQLFDRRMTLNIALFRSDYSNLQVGSGRPGLSPVIVIQNAGSARSQGIEFEQRWAVAKGLTSDLSLVLLDSKYVHYQNASPTAYQTLLGATLQDLSGTPTPYSPKFSGTWRLDYQHPISGNLSLKLGSLLYYTGHYNVSTTNDPLLEQGKYAKLDAHVGIANEASHWDLTLLVRNLTNHTYINYGANTPGGTLGSFSVVKDPPRSFTLQASYHF